jgi:hypothetical protein
VSEALGKRGGWGKQSGEGRSRCCTRHFGEGGRQSRRLCPSCTTRRAIETGAHLESVLPRVAHRQWTLSLPYALRFEVVKQPRVLIWMDPSIDYFRELYRVIVFCVRKVKTMSDFEMNATAAQPDMRGLVTA